MVIFGLSQNYAQNTTANINRICRNGNDNIVNLTFRTDTCTTMFPIELWGRETSISPFVLISNNVTKTATFLHINANVPSNKLWEYYLRYTNNCNSGNEEVYTDTIVVDIVAPKLTTIDSVSVIPETNTVIIGWSKNQEKDFSHYSLFNYNRPDPRVNEFITDTFYRDSNSGNVNTTVLNYELTTIDSCGNRTSFGNSAHSTIVLNATVDTCKSTAILNWSHYIGWSKIKEYYVFRKTNAGNYVLINTLPATQNNYTDNAAIPPNNYSYFIRAKKDTTIWISSSSNSVVLDAGKRIPNIPPTILSITVGSNNTIEALINKDANANYGSVELYKEVNNNLVYVANMSATNNIELPGENITTINKYRLITANACNYPEDTCVASNNIVLTLSEPTNINLTWNKYSTWNNGVQEYIIYRASGTSIADATNFVEIGRGTSTIFSEPGDLEKTSCYYVEAIEMGGSNKSKSNTVCNIRKGDVYYPNAINLSGTNNRFIFIGNGIDLSATEFTVYNRWGAVVYSSNNLNGGWYGVDMSGKFLNTDVYFFTATIKKYDGEYVNKKGNITIIK